MTTLGGYDYEFVTKPLDIFVCKICYLPSRDPHLSMCCGHIFCKSCLDHAKEAIVTLSQRSYYYNACPVCRNEEFATVPNKQIHREVRSLQIFCTNKERGCTWQGEINNLCNHLECSNGCQYEVVKCFNACGIKLQRQYLTDHVNTQCPQHIIKCQYCRVKRKRKFITGKHIENCPRLPLLCPNRCGINDIPREDIDKHREMCPCENVPCHYSCGKQMQRKYLTNHIEAECPRRTVMCQYCSSLIEHQFVEDHHKEHCHKFPLLCPNYCGIEDIPREDISDHRNICPLEIVHCTNNCGEEELQRRDLGDHLDNRCMYRNVSCQYCSVEGECWFIKGPHFYKECPKVPLTCPNKCDIGTVCRGVMDQHRRKCPLEPIGCEYYRVGCDASILRKDLEKHSKENMEEHLLLTTKKLDSTEDELETLQERVHTLEKVMQHIMKTKLVDQNDKIVLWPSHLQLASSMVENTPGEHVIPVIIKMSNFTDLKLQKKKRLYSMPFYTHEKGYKMCLSVYPNGCSKGEGTHMSVFLCVMKGSYDDHLGWPLKGDFEVSLLNQLSDTEHHVHPVSFNHHENVERVLSRNVGSGQGSQAFISNEKLMMTGFCQFLSDDCVFFKVATLRLIYKLVKSNK